VDIFFVISGYLISSIIFKGIAEHNFNLLDFYGRRIKRIFPALATVLGACLLVGWFILLPDEYLQLGKHAFFGAVFGSNLILYSESGYFDTSASTKILLHLWSLGIEEQFYLLWPLLLLFATRLRVNMVVITITIALISFSINIYEIRL